MAQENPPVEADRGDFFEMLDEETKAKEPEPAAEPEKVVEEEPKTEAAKEPEENIIPQSRFKAAIEKERTKTEAALARAKELESQLNVQKMSEDLEGAQAYLKTLIKERNQNLSDGTLDKAGELDDQILELQGAIADRRAEARVGYAKEMAKEEMRFDNAIERLEEAYSALDPESDDYDQDQVDEVRALMRGYQAELGLAPSAAVVKAAKRVFGSLKIEKTERPVEDRTDETGKNRKKEAVERNIDAAKKQPAATKSLGLDHDKRGGGLDAKSVMSMNYEEFAKLGDDVKSKLRGDTL